MANKFIFDVDGTLTPSRGVMDVNFKAFFNTFCLVNDVYLVTGSDKAKTIEQITEPTYNLCKRVYNCNGNDVWEGKEHIRTSDWILPSWAHEFLSEKLCASSFPLRTGLHFEHRPGMVNFSVVGRNANAEERAEYVAFDKERKERESIAEQFNYLFPGIEAKVGGETGLDIAPKGSDKSQILQDFSKDDLLIFFGDRIDPAGNDWPLAEKIMDDYKGKCYGVKDYTDTWKILKEYV